MPLDPVAVLGNSVHARSARRAARSRTALLAIAMAGVLVAPIVGTATDLPEVPEVPEVPPLPVVLPPYAPPFVTFWQGLLASEPLMDLYWKAATPYQAMLDMAPAAREENLTALAQAMRAADAGLDHDLTAQNLSTFFTTVLYNTIFAPQDLIAAFANLTDRSVPDAVPRPPPGRMEAIRDILGELPSVQPPEVGLPGLPPLIAGLVPGLPGIPVLPVGAGGLPQAPGLDLPVGDGLLPPLPPLPPVPPAPPLPGVPAPPLPPLPVAGMSARVTPVALPGTPPPPDPADPVPGSARAASYLACARLAGENATCSEDWVPLGTPVPLDFAPAPGAEVTVLLAPAGTRAASRLAAADGPEELVATAQALAAEGAGLADSAGVGVSLHIQTLAEVPCMPSASLDPAALHVELGCEIHLPGPVPPDTSFVTEPRELAAQVYVVYNLPNLDADAALADPFHTGPSHAMVLGVDGTASRLPAASHVDVLLKDLAGLPAGRLLAEVAASFQAPGEDLALILEAGAPDADGRPNADNSASMTFAMAPVPDLVADLDMALDGSRLNGTLQATLRPLLDLTYNARAPESGVPGAVAQRRLDLRLDTLPTFLELGYQTITNGATFHYNSSASIATANATYMNDNTSEHLTGNAVVYDLPTLVDLHVQAGEKNGNVAYDANGKVPRITADIHKFNRRNGTHTNVTGVLLDLPPRLHGVWNFTEDNRTILLNASASPGPVELNMTTLPGGLALHLYAEGLPPWLDIHASGDYTVNASTSFEGPRHGADVGHVELQLATNATLFEGECTKHAIHVCIEVFDNRSETRADIVFDRLRGFGLVGPDGSKYLEVNATGGHAVALSVLLVSRQGGEGGLVEAAGIVDPLPSHLDLSFGGGLVEFHGVADERFDAILALRALAKESDLASMGATEFFPQGIDLITYGGSTMVGARMEGIGPFFRFDGRGEAKTFNLTDWDPVNRDVRFRMLQLPLPTDALGDRTLVDVALTGVAPAAGAQDINGHVITSDPAKVPPTTKTQVVLLLKEEVHAASPPPWPLRAPLVGNIIVKQGNATAIGVGLGSVPSEVRFTYDKPAEGESFVVLDTNRTMPNVYLDLLLKDKVNQSELHALLGLHDIPDYVDMHLGRSRSPHQLDAGPVLFLNATQPIIDLAGRLNYVDPNSTLQLDLYAENLGNHVSTVVISEEDDMDAIVPGEDCNFATAPEPKRNAYRFTSMPAAQELYVGLNTQISVILHLYGGQQCPINGSVIKVKFFVSMSGTMTMSFNDLALRGEGVSSMEFRIRTPAFIDVKGTFSKIQIDLGMSNVIVDLDIGGGVDVCIVPVNYCIPVLALPTHSIPVLNPHFWVAHVHQGSVPMPLVGTTPCIATPVPPFFWKFGVNVNLPLSITPHPHNTVPIPSPLTLESPAGGHWTLLPDPAFLGQGLAPWWLADLILFAFEPQRSIGLTTEVGVWPHATPCV